MLGPFPLETPYHYVALHCPRCNAIRSAIWGISDDDWVCGGRWRHNIDRDGGGWKLVTGTCGTTVKPTPPQQHTELC